MADRIKGITIEIGGDTTGLSKSLQGVNSEIKNTQSQLKDVERLLKLDPGNVELLQQKQKLLKDAIGETKDKLEALNAANEQISRSVQNYDSWKAKYDPIKAQIDDTKKKLSALKEEAAEAEVQLAAGEISEEKYQALQEEIANTSKELRTLNKEAREVNEEFGNPVSTEQYDALQREIIETEQRLESLEKQAASSNAVLAQIGVIGDKFQQAGEKLTDVGTKLLPVTGIITGFGTLAVKTAADFDSSMSKVEAVSGATLAEMEQLREKAREMGAQTKFSASEAAEAMNYMAMAGWKTEDMLSGIEGIMNLAAASGENLASTSDIVTDALTAFGLGASDAGHFADVLAAASSNANTNVSMMGETFKYVAPVAGSLGYSVDDVAVAIGLMANNGIKASQAGTQLRTAMANMTKPTDAMAKVMRQYDISLTDAEGNMYSWAEMMDQLRTKMAVTTDEQSELNYRLAQEQLIREGSVSVSHEQIDALDEMEDAQRKYTIAVGIGSNALEALTGKEYDELSVKYLGVKASEESLDAAQREYLEYQKGLEILGDTTAAKQAEAAATLFGKEAMSGMLSIINASETDYKKLTKAIKSADGMTKAMADTMQDNLEGQLAILKSQLEELFISIGSELMPIIRDLVSMLQRWMDKLNALSPEQKKMIITIAAVVAALGPLLIIIGKLSTGIGALMNLVSSLGSMFSLLGAASGPIFLTIAAVTALAAIFGHVADKSVDYRNEARQLSEQEEEHKNRIDKLHDSYLSLSDARRQSMESANTESAKNQLLLEELKSITDENGNVMAGYENRAQVITNQLANALGTEIQLTDNQIQNYQELCAELDLLIQKKQANALLDANEAAYAEALTSQKDAYMAYRDAKADVETVTEALIAAQEAEAQARERANSLLKETAEKGMEENAMLTIAMKEYQNTSEQVAGLSEKLSGLNNTLQKAEETYIGYNTIIENYEGLSAAIVSGDLETISDAVLRTVNDFQTAETGTKETLERQTENLRSEYEAMREAIEAGAPGIKQAQVDAILELLKASEAELKKLRQQGNQAGEDMVSGYTAGISGGLGAVVKASKEMADASVEAARTALDSHSPSHITEEIGKDYDTGYALGITNNTSTAVAAVRNLVNDSVAQMQNLPSMSRQWGSDFMDGFISSMRGKISDLSSACSKVAGTVASYLHFSRPDVGPLREYETWMPDFVEGLSSGIDENIWKLEASAEKMSGILGGAGLDDKLVGIERTLNTWLPQFEKTSDLPPIYLVLDTGVVVGQLAPQIDQTLGGIQLRSTRRV